LKDIYIGYLTEEDIGKIDALLQKYEEEHATKEMKIVFLRNLLELNSSGNRKSFINMDIGLFNSLYDCM
jgi:hypothetical protein